MHYSITPDKTYLYELLRPWKLISFCIAMSWLLYGALHYEIADWDVGITIIMGGLTYLTAPLVIHILFSAVKYRARFWYLHIVVAFIIALFVIDWVYVLYHTLMGNHMYRADNFYASTPLYFMAGLCWYYQGSLKALINNIQHIYKTSPRLQLTIAIVRKYGVVITACILLMIMTLLRQLGIILLFILPIIILWLLYSIFIMKKYVGKRHSQTVKIAIVISTLLIVIFTHFYLALSTRDTADNIIAHIKTYKTAHGVYPETLEQVNNNYGRLKKEMGFSYKLIEGYPQFSYNSTFVLLSWYEYNFEENRWSYAAY